MPNMEYKSELYIISHARKDQDGKLIQEAEKLDIPVDSFEVDGGANRRINLKSTSEISVSSEFEQARVHKNIIFYIPPSKDFLALKLTDLRKDGPEWFNLVFVISIYSQGKLLKTLRISSLRAWFVRSPAPEGSPPLLKAIVRFQDAQLFHGQLDPSGKKIVQEQV